uniref:Centromere-associated protein E n=1 Tax=Labrus bergylta TaxID=56723 RepID=A0A3Q3GKL8_9LABR
MTQESAVKVCVRVRPLIESAASESAEPAHLFWKADKKSIHQIDDGNSTKSFSFDRVFTAQETTNQLYQNIAKPLVVSTVEGYNGTIFAYGQTSSGKTFTMMGSNGTPGVIPLAVEDVFQTIKNFPKKEFLLRVSYMEIYNETVSDLLVDSWKRKPLEVRETINKNIYVADLTEELVTNPSQALSWIRKGESKIRVYFKHNSYLHTRLILESRERSDPASGENADGAIIVSHLNLVDLAGSERASQTGAEGKCRFKEGCNINRSLFTLGQVIKKLTDESQKGFTNYRDSKLTRILQNSLGGNAKTVIICTITPVTLEETLSTLQFASTAKKMKNDPHVTEVSDDGALLKRYRNEIVDLKRRLNEVSSVTQTTATEKDFLSQLLQEKDQLQREQEDRIRNLTQLLVTSSNQISAPKRPKRRVTWGGKMLRLAHPSAFEGGMSELSFAEPFSGKRKAERSYLSEMTGEYLSLAFNVLYSNTSLICVFHLFSSPKDFVSPDRMRELSSKVSHLEMQLEMEIQQKEEAMMKVETLDDKVSELEQQLQMENQQKGEAMMKVETLDDKVSELEQQLQTENQQKEEAMMKVETLDDKVSELEQQLQTENQQKEEAMTEVETSDGGVSELEQQLQAENQQKQEALEKVEMLEVRVADLERQLEELYYFKTSIESITVLNIFASPLQSGKDLVQEVAKLRRSLDDAEGLSRDTKKEWAHLRSENIALEESNVTLTTNHENMEAEVSSLRFQLEKEKSRYRQMQSDLQKELNVVFDENTKLTTLLDGKVPKNLIDSVELERTVASLNRELAVSREAEEALRAQLDELASIQTLQDKVDNLTQQVCELTEELCAAQTHRDSLISAQAQSQEEALQLRDALQMSQEEILTVRAELSDAALREEQVKEQVELATQVEVQSSPKSRNVSLEVFTFPQMMTLSEQLQSVESERDALLRERTADSQTEEMEKLQHRVTSLSEDRDQLQDTLDTLRQEKQQLREESEGRMETLQEEVCVCQRAFLQGLSQYQNYYMNVLFVCGSYKKKKIGDVFQMIENQEELRVSQEKIRVLQEEINVMRKEKTELEGKQSERNDGEATLQIQQLQNKLQSVESERDALLRERTADSQTHSEEMEKLQHRVTSLSEDRYQLQETLEAVRQEKQQLREEMETLQEEVCASPRISPREAAEQKRVNGNLEREFQEKDDALDQQVSVSLTLTEELQSVSAERDKQVKTLSEKLTVAHTERDAVMTELETSCLSSSEDMEKLQHRVTSLSEDRDQLQETLEAVRQEKQQLTQTMEDRMETLQEEVCVFQRFTSKMSRFHSLGLQRAVEKVSRPLKRQIIKEINSNNRKSFNQYLASWTVIFSSTSESLENSEVNHNFLKDATVSEQLQSVVSERDALLCKRTADSQTHIEEMEKLQHRVTSLSEDRDQLQETLEAVRQEKQQLTQTMEDRMEMVPASLDTECFWLSKDQVITSTPCYLPPQDHVQVSAQGYRTLFEELVRKDLDVYEERRLQDVLLCRAQAPSFSVKDEDFNSMWEQRLSELLDKRNLYLQIDHLAISFPTVYKCDIASFLQGIIDEHNSLFKEMKLLQTQTDTRLQEERSRRSTLLQPLEGAPLKTELSLMKDNKQLCLQLQETEERIKVCVYGVHVIADGWCYLFNLTSYPSLCPVSLVSAQQAEISKWKSRAIKLKAKNRTDADKPSPPCTPTKRGLPSPMKQLDSPNVHLLDSPKSRFFDVGGGTELLSRTCPKQFFDNSSLGTVPGKLEVDCTVQLYCAGASADRKDEWWPQSPKQEDMCKTQ